MPVVIGVIVSEYISYSMMLYIIIINENSSFDSLHAFFCISLVYHSLVDFLAYFEV